MSMATKASQEAERRIGDLAHLAGHRTTRQNNGRRPWGRSAERHFSARSTSRGARHVERGVRAPKGASANRRYAWLPGAALF